MEMYAACAAVVLLAAACVGPPTATDQSVEPDSGPLHPFGDNLTWPQTDDPAWPEPSPLPPAFDFPPWITMPAPGQFSIGWRTMEPTSGFVRYYTEPDHIEVLYSSKISELHHVRITDLPPGVAVHYEVVITNDGSHRSGTFVPPGRKNWRFVHLAEFHAPTQSAQVAAFANSIRQFRPHLLVESGDMADSGNALDQWRSYLRTSAPWISNVILLPAQSNHVNGFLGNAHFRDLFELPNNERWYTTRAGQVQFVTMDSTYNLVNDNPDIPYAQVDWLAATIRDAHDGRNDPRFVVAAWHYPACSSHYAGRASDRNWVMDNFVHTMQVHGGAELIMVGHDKYYERSIIAGGIVHVQTNAGLLAPSVEGGNHENCTALVTDTTTRSVGFYRVSDSQLDAVILAQDATTLDSFTVSARTP